MHPKALLAFKSLAFFLDTALTEETPNFSHPESNDPDQGKTPTISTGGGGSGSKGQGSCPNQTYDPSGLFCSGDSGPFVLLTHRQHPSLASTLSFFPSFLSFRNRDLLPSPSKEGNLTWLLRLHRLLFPNLRLCELDFYHRYRAVASVHLQVREKPGRQCLLEILPRWHGKCEAPIMPVSVHRERG